MKADDPNIKWVAPPEMGWSEKTYLPLVVDGMRTTLKHLFSPKVTVEFPDEPHKIPDPLIYRGVHRLNRDEQGRVKCVACFLCATACPAHCIDIVAAESPWPDREKYPQSFTIDELRCIFCGMCEEACPVDAIELTSLYDLSGKSREEMIFDKEKLLSIYDLTKDREPMQSVLRRQQDKPVGTEEPGVLGSAAGAPELARPTTAGRPEGGGSNVQPDGASLPTEPAKGAFHP
jgi:NADH-quinone oxidoreductase subunit I